jgi:hypothetical protein
MSERRQLINLAYRLLRSLAEADDAARETDARWYALPAQQREAIASPGGWLTTVASRICLDLLGSARARRERLRRRMVPRAAAQPRRVARVALDKSVSKAFLVVLESMPGRARRVHPVRRLRLLLGNRPAPFGGYGIHTLTVACTPLGSTPPITAPASAPDVVPSPVPARTSTGP